MVAYDPGASGGFAWRYNGNIHTAPIPDIKKVDKSQIKQIILNFKDIMQVISSSIDGRKILFVEEIGARPSDTPKTAFTLAMNYLAPLIYAEEYGFEVKYVRPVLWQNQLPFILPSGMSNYGLRKKLLYDFAKKKYPVVQQYLSGKTKVSAPTLKTADALCIHWVFEGLE